MYDSLAYLIFILLNGTGKTLKMDIRPKWSWKVLENAREKVLESYGKPLLLFCTHLGFGCITVAVFGLVKKIKAR